MYYYGICREHGAGGLSRDTAEAEAWYRKALAADKDYCYAYIGLARLYTRGEGMHKDLQEAARIYREAEARGCTAPGRLPE
jgi:TPR repeat protein